MIETEDLQRVIRVGFEHYLLKKLEDLNEVGSRALQLVDFDFGC
mgnify:CR=1 FL=1